MELSRLIGASGLNVENSASKPTGSGESGKAFAKSIGETLAATNEDLNQAEASARDLAAGKGDLVETMIALGRADLSLRMVVNMRNRMLESYNEIMRLQV